MKNVTITLSEEMARKARIFAAEHNTSVSKYVGSLLENQLRAEEKYDLKKAKWNAWTPSAINETGAKYATRDELHER
jgi:plasmid stability protein